MEAKLNLLPTSKSTVMKMRRRNRVPIKYQEVMTMVRDPICGMKVSESQATASLEYKGQRFYFCALSCYDAFDRDPERYVISKKQGLWKRFLNRLAQVSQETYGHKPPRCH